LLLSSNEVKSVHARNAASDVTHIWSISAATSALRPTFTRYAALRETRH
jgi:hypothetical protein